MSKTICMKCNKPIRGQKIVIVPPHYLIELGLKSVESFHPKCSPDYSVEIEELNECGDLEDRLNAALRSI